MRAYNHDSGQVSHRNSVTMMSLSLCVLSPLRSHGCCTGSRIWCCTDAVLDRGPSWIFWMVLLFSSLSSSLHEALLGFISGAAFTVWRTLDFLHGLTASLWHIHLHSNPTSSQSAVPEPKLSETDVTCRRWETGIKPRCTVEPNHCGSLLCLDEVLTQ